MRVSIFAPAILASLLSLPAAAAQTSEPLVTSKQVLDDHSHVMQLNSYPNALPEGTTEKFWRAAHQANHDGKLKHAMYSYKIALATGEPRAGIALAVIYYKMSHDDDDLRAIARQYLYEAHLNGVNVPLALQLVDPHETSLDIYHLGQWFNRTLEMNRD